jgi:hypothetical protein
MKIMSEQEKEGFKFAMTTPIPESSVIVVNDWITSTPEGHTMRHKDGFILVRYGKAIVLVELENLEWWTCLRLIVCRRIIEQLGYDFGAAVEVKTPRGLMNGHTDLFPFFEMERVSKIDLRRE